MSGEMKILVGCDGAEQPSRDALALGALLAETCEADLTLGVVVPGIAPRDDSRSHEEDLGAASAATFDRATAQLAEFDARLVPQCRAIGGKSPADGLRDLATGEGADLIVVGSTHRGPLGRIVPGTTADQLGARSRVPFAVAPRGYAERDARELRIVGVAYDGSDEARRAAEVATDFAIRGCTGLRAFGVLEPLVANISPAGPLPLDDHVVGDRLEEELDELLDRLPASVAGQKLILAGDPARALLAQGPRAADLMVFGSHGFGRFLRLVGWSVTSPVMRDAPWPVIVVPPKHNYTTV
jgi:nucleotide-binding universal stress UspA family protein